jgi:hypothetical protein
LKQWYLENNPKINVRPFIEQWNRRRDAVYRELLPQVINHLAWAEAVQKVNETLKYNLELGDAGIDEKEVVALLDKIFKVQVAKVFLNQATDLSGNSRRDLLQRILAREFPRLETNNDYDLTHVLSQLKTEVARIRHEKAEDLVPKVQKRALGNLHKVGKKGSSS